ncbi:MAG: LPS-assembly protein LptD [Gammaproteobacteria bacterium]
MRAAVVASVLIAFASPVVLAQSADEPALIRGIGCWPEAVSPFEPDGLELQPIELTTGGADIEDDGKAVFSGPVSMRSGDMSLEAASASYDRKSGVFLAEGGIAFRNGASRVSGESVRYDATQGLFTFTDGDFELPFTPARGSAASMELSRTGYLQLEKVVYTSCPAGNNDWLLKARSLKIDAESGRGTARGASLRFKNVPFLYVPYFTYPVTDERKSGLLFPKVGSSNQRGFELETPVYWNIRPNMDATFIPHYMGKRGLQLGTEYRFLTRRHDGILWGDLLPNDDETGEDRWQYDVRTQSFLPWAWRSTIKATGVSDDNYYEDMTSSRQLSSQTNLERKLDLEQYTRNWSLFLRVRDFQTIDPEILPEDEPYAQMPQLVADGSWRNGLLGLDYKLGTEAVYFHRKDNINETKPNGARLHVQPEVALPLEYNGFYLTPEIALDYAGYQLDGLPAGQNDSPSRSAPIANIDSGAIFDRLAGKSNQLLITLEPRVQYTYIPFRDQSDIPIFDTIVPDFNLVQLFRKNRFIGYDRLGDTNQLSAGITSRVLDSSGGRQLLALTIGQTRYFETGQVTLSDDDPETFDTSNYIAELSIRAWRNWTAGVELQYDATNDRTARTSARVQYKPDDSKAINLGYRYVRESLEQVDVAAAWAISEQWSAIARYNYSLLEDKPLDQFVGLEYESCCWAIRVLGRRSVARSTGQSDSSISFQFELKGFSNVGSSSITGLERDILDDRSR